MFEYAIGTAADAEAVRSFTDVGLGLQFAATDLNLVSGVTYFVAVRGTFGVRGGRAILLLR